MDVHPGAQVRHSSLIALGIAVVAFGFQQTAIIPALPTIQSDLHASRGWSAWLLSGYLVASAVFTPLVGKLGDRFGMRRMLLVSLVVFLVGSVGATFAPGLGVLVACRAVQGVGGAVFPLTLALAREHLPRVRVQHGVSVLAGGFGLGTALGFGLSGVLVELGSWRWIFAVGAIALLLATTVVPLLIPPSAAGAAIAIDVAGATLLAAGLALPLVALTEGPERGWSSPWTVGAFALGVAALAAWVARDLRVNEPLLDLRLLARRSVLLTNLASVGLGYALFGIYFLVPYLLRSPVGAGASGPIADGLFLLPVALGQLAGGPGATPLTRRIGDRATFAAGLVLIAAGAGLLAGLHEQVPPILVATLLVGLGAGLAIAVASTIITRTAVDAETGVATSMNSVLRRVGGGVGGQVGAALTAGAATASAASAEGAFVLAFGLCAAVSALGAMLSLGVERST